MDASPSEAVLEDTPTRALTFLRGITKYPQIQDLLALSGYTPDEHLKGWNLTLAVIGAPTAAKSRAPVTTPAMQAMMTIDAWDEKAFALIDAALEGSFPEQHAFVFAGGLGASVGVASVVGVQTMLERLSSLETGKDRPKASQSEDQAALARLAERGISKAERDRLAGLLQQAKSLEPATTPADDSAQQAALHALYLWHREWSKVARVEITKRVYLIALGLAKRKSAKKPAPAPAPVPAPVPASAPAPAATKPGATTGKPAT